MKIAPILILAYNRPDYLKKVVDFLRLLDIDKIYFSIDGPKPGNYIDTQLVMKCREIAESAKSWCEVEVLAIVENLGCYVGVTTGINWFFKHEDSGIILEDDLVFDSRALEFLTQGLERYKYDLNVGSICAYNHLVTFGESLEKVIGFNVSFPSSWGWGTWRNRWEYLERDFASYSNLMYARNMWKFGGASHLLHWMELRRRLLAGTLDSWAYRWLITHVRRNWLSVIPSVSLVNNIGFRSDATHTKAPKAIFGKTSFSQPKMVFTFHFSDFYNSKYQKLIERKVYGIYPFRLKISNRFKR